MEYNILIETDFFNLLNAGHKNKGGNALENSYREFIKVVVDLCSTNVKQAVFALSYAETELDFHLSMPHIKDCLGTVGLYVRKAIAFVRRMQEHVAATYHLHVTTSTSEASPPVSLESKPLVKWTGNAVDLVEMVYGICVMGSVNDGDVKFMRTHKRLRETPPPIAGDVVLHQVLTHLKHRVDSQVLSNSHLMDNEPYFMQGMFPMIKQELDAQHLKYSAAQIKYIGTCISNEYFTERNFAS